MRITMTTTLEHPHLYVVRDGQGTPSIKRDVREFLAGRTYDHSSEYPEWERRAKLFIDNDWAVKI